MKSLYLGCMNSSQTAIIRIQTIQLKTHEGFGQLLTKNTCRTQIKLYEKVLSLVVSSEEIKITMDTGKFPEWPKWQRFITNMKYLNSCSEGGEGNSTNILNASASFPEKRNWSLPHEAVAPLSITPPREIQGTLGTALQGISKICKHGSVHEWVNTL